MKEKTEGVTDVRESASPDEHKVSVVLREADHDTPPSACRAEALCP
jgi:hypothetical protein